MSILDNLPLSISSKLQGLSSQALDFAKQTPGGRIAQGVQQSVQQKSFMPVVSSLKNVVQQAGQRITATNPSDVAMNFGPMGFAGTTKPLIKQIDNLTKDEMIKAIDYIRLKQPFNRAIEDSIGHLTEKFGISGRRLGVIANHFERLINSTKTKDISGRVPFFRSSKLK